MKFAYTWYQVYVFVRFRPARHQQQLHYGAILDKNTHDAATEGVTAENARAITPTWIGL